MGRRSTICTVMLSLTIGVTATGTAVGQSFSQAEARSILKRVVSFYRTDVGYEGAYLWRYSADLQHREGEGIATRTSGWTQPPGSPTVGEAYLECWRLTDDRMFLDAAVEVAAALVRAQLESGGWASHFDLGPEGRRYAYRVLGDDRGSNNRTTFDDNKSQSALMLLMHVDEALEDRPDYRRQQATIHDAVNYALEQSGLPTVAVLHSAES